MRVVNLQSTARWAAMVALTASAMHAAPAAAAPSTVTSDAVSAKKAEKKATLADLESMKERLSSEMTAYVALSRRIERTQAEVAEVTAKLGETEAELAESEQAVTARAVELYRSDRIAMVQILFDAQSIPELIDRLSYLVTASRYDVRMIADLQLKRQENLWLQEGLNARIDQLTQLQVEADRQREQIEADIVEQQERAAKLGADIAQMLREQQVPRTFAGGDPDISFTPDTVISDAAFRDADSMTLAEIQAFLDKQPGSLKSYRAPDYRGEVKSAAQMIAEASARWNVSPKVILVKLQKEQSLLGRPNPTQKALDWAMGCGRGDSYTAYQYQGFGKQIWFGASKLDQNAGPWREGITMKIDGSVIRPTNESTYSLYKYTPHIAGTTSFWLIYWRYFGDPLAEPAQQ